MCPIIKYFNFIMLTVFISSSCDVTRIMISPTTPCTIFDMPLDISPSTNTTISVLQSPGLRFFHCDLSQTSISDTDVTISMTMQSRLGSRFCNFELPQVYISVYYQLLKSEINPQWQAYVASKSSNVSKSIISSTTSGISALIQLPSNEIMEAVDCLKKLHEIISNFFVTDDMIENAYISAYYESTTNALTPLNSSSVSTDNYNNIKALILCPKPDATVLNGKERKDGPGTICGGSCLYGASLINQERNSFDGKDYVSYIHQLFATERSLLIFSASKNIFIKNSMQAIAKEFISGIMPTHMDEINIPAFGNSISGGVEHVHIQNSGSGAWGAIIVIDKLNLDSVLCAGLIAKITKNNVFSSILNANNADCNICVYGGKTQLRISAPYSSFSINTTQVLSSYLSQISSRFSTTTNDSDFSNNISIISELIKHFSPGSNNGPANFLTYGISEIYEDSPNAYVTWMEILYGGYNILKKLRELNVKSNLEKSTAISNATKKIVTSARFSITESQSCRIE